MSKKEPRIKIKSKWTQGNQLVLNVRLTYGTKTRDVQSSCGLEMVDNPDQFKAFLEEVWEVNKPRTVDLSKVVTEVE